MQNNYTPHEMSNTHTEKKKVVVVGGGITGLSAAWHLQTNAGGRLEITLVEASPYLGGKMHTRSLDEGGSAFIIDAGPESFVTRKPEAWQLAQELGLAEQIVDPGSETKNMYVLDEGTVKKIPLSPPAFIKSDLLSLRGKARMLLEPVIPAKRDDEDESLASFVSRRLGREALDKMLGPVLAGIYNTNPETQSIMTTSPVMREMEKEYGGLVKGALGRMRAKRKNPPQEPLPPQFITFSAGAQAMVDALEAQLDARVLTGVRVTEVLAEGTGFRVVSENHADLTADAVILAAPGNQSSNMLAQTAPQAAERIAQIDHENIGTATLIFKPGDIALPYPINGLMIPRREKRHIDAITWTSNKPLVRAPQGYEMMRVFFGGADPSMATLPEDEIIATVRAELADILGITAQPFAAAVFTWPESFPQAFVGHLALVDEIEALLPAGVWVAGSSFRGIGVPDCIRQGRQAAEMALNYLFDPAAPFNGTV